MRMGRMLCHRVQEKDRFRIALQLRCICVQSAGIRASPSEPPHLRSQYTLTLAPSDRVLHLLKNLKMVNCLPLPPYTYNIPQLGSRGYFRKNRSVGLGLLYAALYIASQPECFPSTI